MFRGKESSNRIELSRLVQELSNFGVFGFLRLLEVGVGRWGGGWGVPPTHVHTHVHAYTHTCTCMHGKHGNFMQMAAPIGFGEIRGIPYDVIRMCVCMHVHACAYVCMWVGCTFSSPPTHIHPPPHPLGGPLESFKIQ